MTIPEEFRAEADSFPPVLRALLDAELAAGNKIARLGYAFPAPPVGAYFIMTGPITTRKRATGDGLKFRDYNSSIYSGGFTDDRGFFHILEPPLPPEPEPDMDAIRAAHLPGAAKPRVIESDPNTALGRFERSMVVDYEKWHDGVGYDIEALRAAKLEEPEATEDLLLSRGIQDWRDVEALAALNTPPAREAVKAALSNTDPAIRMAVTRYAPELVSSAQRTASLVRALATAKVFEGLSQALLEAEEYHPKEVMDALFRRVLSGDGETAVNVAALVLFLHGKASAAFDWDQRPFFLRFNTEDRAARKAVFLELCDRIGVRASDHM